MNALVESKGGAVANTGGNAFLETVAEMGGAGSQFMKFNGSTGRYSVGQEDEEVPRGTEIAAHIIRALKGWQCWKDGEVVDSEQFSIASGKALTPEEDLPDHAPYTKHDDGTEDGWSKFYDLPLTSLSDGAEYNLKLSSASGLRGMNSLLKDFGNQFKLHPGETPIISLDIVSFEPKMKKKVGKKFAPVLKIVRWIPNEQVVAGGDGEDDPANYEEQDGTPETATAVNAVVETKVEKPVVVETKVVTPAEATVANGGDQAAGTRRARKF